MKLVTPFPCVLQFNDSFNLICEKLGITQEMLKEDENGEINFSSDKLYFSCWESKNLSYLSNELLLHKFSSEKGYLDIIHIYVLQSKDGTEHLVIDLYYMN